MEITEVRIRLMEDPSERLQAFCSITFDHPPRHLKILTSFLPLSMTSAMFGFVTTPNDIAASLGISGKTLRQFLRDRSNGFARSPAQHGQRWEFTRQDAEEIKRAYRTRRAPTDARLKGSTS